MPHMIRQLAHSCFFTDHVEALINFYRGSLGLPVKFTMNNDAGQVMGYYFDCGNSTFIEVFDQTLAVKQWGGQIEALKPTSQYRHLCFEVTGLAELKKALEARGVSVSNITMGIDHSWQAWIADPDGNAIELMEYTAQSPQLGSLG
jgi:lactoylglutathione lyase